MEIRNEGRSSAVSVWASSDSVYQNDQSVSLQYASSWFSCELVKLCNPQIGSTSQNNYSDQRMHITRLKTIRNLHMF